MQKYNSNLWSRCHFYGQYWNKDTTQDSGKIDEGSVHYLRGGSPGFYTATVLNSEKKDQSSTSNLLFPQSEQFEVF